MQKANLELTRKDFKLIRFPNGEFKLMTDVNLEHTQRIIWLYNAPFGNEETLLSPSEEYIALMQLDKLLLKYSGKYNSYCDGVLTNTKIKVITDYIPFLRQDKAKLMGEVVFDDIYNFYKLEIIDYISHNKLNHQMNVLEFIKNTDSYLSTNIDDILFILPDHGALERFNVECKDKSELKYPHEIFSKIRDAKTGALTFDKLNKSQVNNIENKVCFIVDDIVAFGGTFIHVAEELKQAGASKVILVVNHSDGVANIDKLLQNIDAIHVVNGQLNIENYYKKEK